MRFIIGLFLGITLGLSIGLLVAPQPGSQTRRWASQKARMMRHAEEEEE